MRWLILLLALLSSIAAGQDVPGSDYPPSDYYLPSEHVTPPAKELALKLPAFPKDSHLVKIEMDGPQTFDFYVDLDSVSVGSDGIVRYTLVARSPSGVENVTYEGIRCNGHQRKVYAYGRDDGTWAKASDPKWIPISGLGPNRVQSTLYNAYFCPDWTIVRNAAKARERLRQGGKVSYDYDGS